MIFVTMDDDENLLDLNDIFVKKELCFGICMVITVFGYFFAVLFFCIYLFTEPRKV